MKMLHEKCNISREKLIAFSVLTGSDFYKGVRGIGFESALELLRSEAISNDSVLVDFKEWTNCASDEPDVKLPPKIKKLVTKYIRATKESPPPLEEIIKEFYSIVSLLFFYFLSHLTKSNIA